MKPLRLNRTLALGNGTRVAGFELCTLEDFDKACTEAGKYAPQFSKLRCELADGVTEAEVITALRNPLFLSFGDTPKESETAIAAADPEDWRAFEISSEDLEISQPVRDKLAAAGITTLGQLHASGEENDGLQSIEGIGEKTEDDLRDVLKNFMPSAA